MHIRGLWSVQANNDILTISLGIKSPHLLGQVTGSLSHPSIWSCENKYQKVQETVIVAKKITIIVFIDTIDWLTLLFAIFIQSFSYIVTSFFLPLSTLYFAFDRFWPNLRAYLSNLLQHLMMEVENRCHFSRHSRILQEENKIKL